MGRFIDLKGQCMNRRSNHIVTENGEKLSVLQWSKKLKVSHSAIINRLKKGGSVYVRKNTLEAFEQL